MGQELIAFSSMAWQAGAHPLESKKTAAAHAVGLLRFGPGFRDPNLCTRSHAGYVLEGELVFETEEGDLVVRAGEAFAIDAGTGHRAANRGARDATVFIVSGEA